MVIRRPTEDGVAPWPTIRLEGVRLHLDALEGSHDDEGTRSDEMFRQGSTTSTVLAGCSQTELTGCAVFAPMALADMAHRGSGVADVLADAISVRAHRTVLQLPCSVTTANPPTRRLRERQGFEICGTEPRARRVGGVFRDACLMVRHPDRPCSTVVQPG